ncbi:hypothetical protein [Roseovarius aestuarii]|nr:hypothetical protein [Roseovarius aestuarii]
MQHISTLPEMPGEIGVPTHVSGVVAPVPYQHDLFRLVEDRHRATD